MEKKIKQFLIAVLGILMFASGCADEDVTGQYNVIVKPTYVVPTGDQATTTGTVPVDATEYKLGGEITFLGNTGNLTRTSPVGQTFDGWMMPGNSTTVFLPGQVTTIPRTLPSSTLNITVKWTQKVTYSSNGGTGAVPVDPAFYATGATVTAAAQGAITRTGYTFNGWNTLANGTGTARAAGATFAMGIPALTLFAQWSGNPYTITYNGNGNDGGSVPAVAGPFNAGSAVVADNNTGSLTRTNHAFLGWNTNASGTGTNVAAGATINMFTANTTLYAKWQALVCTVTYNGNGNTGGAAPTDATIYQQGQTVPVATKGTLTKTGSNFIAWNTAADGSGTSYLGGANSSFIMGATSVTLYAIWVP